METSVQFADMLRATVVRRDNACPEKQTQKLFFDGSSANIHSAARFFGGRKQNAHLSKITHFAYTLLEQMRQVAGPVVTQKRRTCFDSGRRTISAAVAIRDLQEQVPANNEKFNQIEKMGLLRKLEL